MDRENFFWAAFLGFLVGIVLCGVLVNLPTAYHAMAKLAVEQCEADLPRSQKCVLVAVPEEKRND